MNKLQSSFVCVLACSAMLTTVGCGNFSKKGPVGAPPADPKKETLKLPINANGVTAPSGSASADAGTVETIFDVQHQGMGSEPGFVTAALTDGKNQVNLKMAPTVDSSSSDFKIVGNINYGAEALCADAACLKFVIVYDFRSIVDGSHDQISILYQDKGGAEGTNEIWVDQANVYANAKQALFVMQDNYRNNSSSTASP